MSEENGGMSEENGGMSEETVIFLNEQRTGRRNNRTEMHSINTRLSNLCHIVYIVHCKITYFHWDFISHFCHIASSKTPSAPRLKSKFHIFERVVIENPLNIFLLAGFIFAIIHIYHSIPSWCITS
jgi:hypothetical protein